jgi:predicted DsbA family dithiol-disulfide isomerase
MTTAPLTLDVWTDIQCTWCWIGHERLRRALEATDVPVTVRPHTFQLDPAAPEDFDAATYLRERQGIDEQRWHEARAAIDRLAAPLGLRCDWEQVRPTNSLRASMLLHFAGRSGLRGALQDRLFRAYFTEGRHLSDVETLASLAAEVGLDPEEARRSLRAGEHLPDVEKDRALAARYGINGVPYLVFDESRGLAGAQETEVLVRVFRSLR